MQWKHSERQLRRTLTFDSGCGGSSSGSGWSLPRATICYRLLLHLLVCSGAAPARTLGLVHSGSAEMDRRDDGLLLWMKMQDSSLLRSQEGEWQLRKVLFFLPYHRFCPSSSQHHSLRRHDRRSSLQRYHVKIHTLGLSWWASFFSLPIYDRVEKQR